MYKTTTVAAAAAAAVVAHKSQRVAPGARIVVAVIRSKQIKMNSCFFNNKTI